MDLSNYSGPRIIINPQVMKDDRDALCVAFNEGFRIIQEVNGFDPVAEPTDKQRAFFADTAYRDDERMLRRTILSRICTFDTSVSDPTDEQLEEAVEFLDTVMEIGAPQNQWEQNAVQRIRDAVAASVGQPRAEARAPEPPAEGPAVATAGGGDSRLVRAAIDAQDEEKNMYVSTGQEEQSIADEATGGDAKPSPWQDIKDDMKATGDKLAAMTAADEAADNVRFAKADDLMSKAREASASGDYAGAKESIAAARGAISSVGKVPGQDGQPEAPKVDNFGAASMSDAAKAELASRGQPSGGTDAAGRRLDDHGRVMAGEKPQGRTLTAGEQAWQDRKNASTEAWRQRNGLGDPDGSRASAFGSMQAFFDGDKGKYEASATRALSAVSAGAPGPSGAPGLRVSGKRGNIFEIGGRRVSARAAEAYKKERGLV